jgi:TolB protein
MAWCSQVGVVGLAAAMMAGCSSSTGATAVHSASASPATSASTTVTQAAAHGVEAPIGAVPWSQVGPGWMLATWSPAVGTRPGASPPPGTPPPDTATTTLYLVDPAGGRYAITTLPPSNGGPRKVVDWSSDGSHALVAMEKDRQTVITQVDLHSGTQTTFTVHGDFTPRYTSDGKALVVGTVQVDLAGNEQANPVAEDAGGSLATPDGTRHVRSADSGLMLTGNDGAAGKALPIPGGTECGPLRWWDGKLGTTVLATCSDSRVGARRLWLVPIDGGTPTALTAPNDGQHGPNLGDRNAWQLPAGIFVQYAGACGTVELGKLNADGTTTQVFVPGVDNGHSIFVVGVNGGDLYLHATAACGAGQSLFDYNPAAGTSTALLGPPLNGGGVISVRPYPGLQ